jgi:hypothetical protein
MSSFTYTRNVSELIARWSSSESWWSSLAITAAAGSSRAISSAMFGPESTATGRPCTRVESRSPVAGWRPFVSESTGASPGSAETTEPNVALGTATTTRSAPAIGAPSSGVAVTPLRSTFVR